MLAEDRGQSMPWHHRLLTQLYLPYLVRKQPNITLSKV